MCLGGIRWSVTRYDTIYFISHIKMLAKVNKYIAILWNGKCNICIDSIIPKTNWGYSEFSFSLMISLLAPSYSGNVVQGGLICRLKHAPIMIPCRGAIKWPSYQEVVVYHYENARVCAKWQWNARYRATVLYDRRSVSLSPRTHPGVLAFITYILCPKGIEMALV